MSVKITIAAIAALVAATAAPQVASAHGHARAVQHHTLRTIPWDAYGYVGPVQSTRPSELTGGSGYDFQLGGRF